MIQIVDNYNLLNVEILTNQKDRDEFLKNTKYYCISNIKTINDISITLKDYTSKKQLNNTFFSFIKDEEKRALKNEDNLIISIKKNKNDKDEDVYLAQTGNYVGKFKWNGLEIDIKSRFSNIFLERMLNFANDIFLDDASITGDKTDKELDISKYIIYYMFVQNLEKAFLLGLPKAYRSINHHEMKLKGKIDINKFIKYDIPFQGKVSSVSREQKEIQEIIDTLYKAVKIIEKNKFNTKNISHIKTHLKQHRSNKFVSNETINKALKSKALQNPIFAPYKKVLEYARFIINGNNIEEKSEGKNKTYGFIINVAELFEIYITKLLQKEFPNWSVVSPKIELYNNPEMFYSRKIIPDIVMARGDKDVMVFDTKCKKMLMRGTKEGVWDLDRTDFFQINTYMSYYQNQGKNVIAGGLLYPMEEFIQSECHADNWLGKSGTKFIVDGIDLSSIDINEAAEQQRKKLIDSEVKFIESIRELTNQT